MENKKNNLYLGIGALVVLLLVFLLTGRNSKPEPMAQEPDTEIPSEEEGLEMNQEQESEDETPALADRSGGSSEETLKPFDKAGYDNLMNQAGDAYNAKNYAKALDLYNQALQMEDLAVIHAKMYLTHKALGDMGSAKASLRKAKDLDPTFNQYWFWTIEELRNDGASYASAKQVYDDGLDQVEQTAKVNYIIYFARISEEMGQINEAIKLWQDAIVEHPEKTEVFQGEVERLQSAQ